MGRLNEDLGDTWVSATIATDRCQKVLDILGLKLLQQCPIMIKLLDSHALDTIDSGTTGMGSTDANINCH